MRQDKRAPGELRKIKIERDFVKFAEGSCLIEVGSTRVICTASVENKVPLFLKGSNSGWVTAEYGMLPRSTQIRNLRNRVSGRSMEIQRLIGRALRSVVDLKSIGEKTIWIDCDVIQANGGTRTASVVGGFVALVDCLYTMYRRAIITSIPLIDFLGAASVGIFQGDYILDLTYQEDSEADVDMNVVMKGNGEFVEIQGAAERDSYSREDLNKLLDLAKKGIDEIIDEERNLFKDIVPNL